jgi:hypothetical protein
MSMKRRRTVRLLGAGLAVLVPALAIAAFNVPHAFQSGEVLTAQNLNDNFNAVKAELESLQARVAALENGRATKAEVQAVQTKVTTVEGTTTELSRVSLSKCQWHWKTCNAQMSEECQLTCPSGTFPLAGGCDSTNATSVSEHRPSVAEGAAFPPSPSSPKAYTIYTCESANGVLQNTYALCCPL